MKLKAFILAALLAAFMTGCTTITSITPYDHGYAAGTAAYAGYSRVAKGKSEEFQAGMAEFWGAVNKIESTDTLATDIVELSGAFDKVLASDELTDEERMLLLQIKKIVLSKVDAKVSGELLEHKDAVEFLKGVRDGVNAMMALKPAAQGGVK